MFLCIIKKKVIEKLQNTLKQYAEIGRHQNFPFH